MSEKRVFFIKLLVIISGLSSVHAVANVTCVFDNSVTPPSCKTLTISPVTTANETIYVNGQPTTYVDLTKASMNIDSTSILTYFPTNIFNYFPKIRVMYVENASISVMVTDSFIKCTSLDYVQVNFNSFPLLPDGFAQKCTKIRELWFKSNKIQTIDPNALRGLSMLTHLELKDNLISCIPNGLFSFSSNIEFVDFSNNQILNLEPQVFATLPNLDYIGFENNLMCYIPNLAFTGSGTGIQFEARFSGNPLYAINSDLISNIYSVRNDFSATFDLSPVQTSPTLCLFGAPYQSADGISILSPNVNSSFSKCYENFTPAMAGASSTCDVAVTTLLCTPPTTTTSTTTTTTSTTETSTTIPSTLPQIQCATDKICRYYLDWNNQYTCVIDGAEGTVTSISGTHYLSFTDADLTRLYFTNSHLGKVPNVLFQKFPNLKYLHIRNTGLSVINDQTFNECGNLEFLDASDNEIFRVEETALKNCTKLKIIDLTGNEIDHVSVGLYQNDPSLQRVHLRRLSDWILA